MRSDWIEPRILDLFMFNIITAFHEVDMLSECGKTGSEVIKDWNFEVFIYLLFLFFVKFKVTEVKATESFHVRVSCLDQRLLSEQLISVVLHFYDPSNSALIIYAHQFTLNL